jgi:FixJ family two-component response regulator
MRRTLMCVFSGVYDGDLSARWGKEGSLQFIEKPCHPQDLVERIEALVR